MEHRVRSFAMAPEFLADILAGRAIITEGLPRDAKILRTEYSFVTNRLVFLVESPEFEPVGEGYFPPRADITLQLVQ